MKNSKIIVCLLKPKRFLFGWLVGSPMDICRAGRPSWLSLHSWFAHGGLVSFLFFAFVLPWNQHRLQTRSFFNFSIANVKIVNDTRRHSQSITQQYLAHIICIIDIMQMFWYLFNIFFIFNLKNQFYLLINNILKIFHFTF